MPECNKVEFTIRTLAEHVMARVRPYPECHPEPRAKDLCPGGEARAQHDMVSQPGRSG
jgi:hypothetical protein